MNKILTVKNGENVLKKRYKYLEKLTKKKIIKNLENNQNIIDFDYKDMYNMVSINHIKQHFMKLRIRF